MEKELVQSNEFIFTLTGYKLNYITLLYANVILHSHITDEKLHQCLASQDFVATVNYESLEGLLFLNSELINSEIKSFLKLMNFHPDVNSTNAIWQINREKNAHFLRTRILNAVYEEISYYFENDKKQWAHFHTLNWFQILYLLRNNASHNNNVNRKIRFPKWKWLLTPYPEKVTWETIEIHNEQFGHEIRYNDQEILSLINCVIEYFTIKK